MAGPISTHLLPETATIGPDGHLIVGGVDMVDLAAEHGTPLFVYDEYHLRKRCQDAVWAFGPGVAYASKAFLCAAMAKLAYEEGMHVDVASAGEGYVALRAGVPASHLVFHGNNKSTSELTYALEHSFGHIVVDSTDELERLKRLANFGHRKPKVLLRVTPGIEPSTHSYVATGQEDSKFGFSISSGAAMDAVIRSRNPDSGVELVGVHTHIGSTIDNLETFASTVERVAAFFMPLGLAELVIGGGLGVPYTNDDTAPTLREWGNVVKDAATKAGISSSVRLSAEPGRSIVATAGMTLYGVGTIKDLPEIRTYVSVDGGFIDNLRPALYGARYEAFLPRAAGAERTKPARIVGKHCESGDVLIGEAWLPDDVAVGDVLCTPVTGAYGYAMANNYNKLLRPSVVFVNDGRTRVVVRRECYDDLLRNDVF